MMQAIGRSYVRYFNNRYHRTGTLWEGRFKFCLIEDEKYLLQVYRYIELNPVRAKMVVNISDYKWSSYQINGLGVRSELCRPHALYIALGSNKNQRLICYQQLCAEGLSDKLLSKVRTGVNAGLALGSDKFKKEVEILTGRRILPLKKGRPTK
jgi:putative transposase